MLFGDLAADVALRSEVVEDPEALATSSVKVLLVVGGYERERCTHNPSPCATPKTFATTLCRFSLRRARAKGEIRKPTKDLSVSTSFDISEHDVVLLGVMGSQAFGLATPLSDTDLVGVFLAPTPSVLSLDAARVIEQTYAYSQPDVTLHELAKFLRLGLRANPTIIELLFAENYELITPLGHELVGLRQYLISTDQVRSAFMGYAESQRKAAIALANKPSRVSSYAAITKHARHCVRLLRSAEQLLSSGQLTLNVANARDEIFSLGNLAYQDPARFDDYVAKRTQELARCKSVLPESCDRERINKFLVRARLLSVA